METIIIKSFTERDALEVTSSKHPTCGNLVALRQHTGSCYFSFSMTPDQARAMAEALVQHAAAVEA